ncbi:MAG: hypothetical protein WBO32_08355, partial [Cyclobacteriaceae bacterium]
MIIRTINGFVNWQGINISFTKRAYLTVGFFFISYFFLSAQTITISDSIESIYSAGNYRKESELKILKELAINHSNNDKKLLYSEKLIQK